MLYQFQVYNKVIQLQIHIYSFIFRFRLLQNIEQCSLCYTVGCFWLSLLYIVIVYVGFPGSAEVKNQLSMVETQEKWVESLGREDPLERGMATHSSILAWKISWTEDPVGLQSMESKRVRHDSCVCLSQAPNVSLPQHFSSGNHKLVFDIQKSVSLL